MDGGSARLAEDLRIKRGNLCRAYDDVDVLIAKATHDGELELLSAGWERILGYSASELDQCSLSDLILEKRAASALVLALLDQRNSSPLSFPLRCKNGRYKRFVWYRNYDRYDSAMYLFGDEVLAQRRNSLRTSS